MSSLDTEVYSSIYEVNRNQWDNLVDNSDRGSIFQSYDWLAAIESTVDVTPRHGVVSKDGNPKGVLPNFLTDVPVVPLQKLESLPLGSGGPIISSDEEEVLKKLLIGIQNDCPKQVVTHEITAHDGKYMRYGQPLAHAGYRAQLSHCRFLVDVTQTWNDITAAMSSRCRYDIRNAVDQDFEVTEASLNSSTLRSFHESYQTAMERVNGSAYPLSFFDRLSDDLSHSVRIVQALVENKLVGSHFYVEDGDRMHHLFSAVKRDNFEYYPSELIHRHMIQSINEEGFEQYDFGSTAASFDDGIFKYKHKYGGTVVPNLQWKKPMSRILHAAFKTGTSVYKSIR